MATWQRKTEYVNSYRRFVGRKFVAEIFSGKFGQNIFSPPKKVPAPTLNSKNPCNQV